MKRQYFFALKLPSVHVVGQASAEGRSDHTKTYRLSRYEWLPEWAAGAIYGVYRR